MYAIVFRFLLCKRALQLLRCEQTELNGIVMRARVLVSLHSIVLVLAYCCRAQKPYICFKLMILWWQNVRLLLLLLSYYGAHILILMLIVPVTNFGCLLLFVCDLVSVCTYILYPTQQHRVQHFTIATVFLNPTTVYVCSMDITCLRPFYVFFCYGFIYLYWFARNNNGEKMKRILFG